MFDSPVVATRSWGRKGGGAELTARGNHLVRIYREAERMLEERTSASLREVERWLAPADVDRGAAS